MDSPEAPTFDVVVLGSGVAGTAAALFASIRGLSVLVLEKAMVVGSTSALSAGTAWIPGTTHAAKVNPNDTRENAERYLRAAVGNRLDPDKLDAFLTHTAMPDEVSGDGIELGLKHGAMLEQTYRVSARDESGRPVFQATLCLASWWLG